MSYSDEEEKPDYSAEISQLRSEINTLKQKRQEKEEEKKKKKEDSDKYEKALEQLKSVIDSVKGLKFPDLKSRLEAAVDSEETGTRLCNEVTGCSKDFEVIATSISAVKTKATEKKKELDDKIKELENEIKDIDRQIAEKESQIRNYECLM